MPKTKTKDDAVVVALSSFSTDNVPGSGVIAQGTRLRASNPIVKAVPHLFVPDGATAEELHAARRALHADAYAELEKERITHQPAPPKPVRDEDAVVATRTAGSYSKGKAALSATGESLAVAAGDKVAKTHPAVKADPDAFVPVVPPGLQRKDALEALAYMSNLNADGELEYEVHEGTWVPRDHPAARVNPAMFRAVR